MLIIHVFWTCPSCHTETEVTDQDVEAQEIECTKCGYQMEFSDQRFETWEEVF